MLLGLITSQPPFLYPWTESKLFFINFGSKIPGRSSSLHPLSTSPPLSGVGGGIGTTVSHTCRLRTLRALDFDLERGQNYRALIGKEVKRERSNEPWPLSARVCRRKEGRKERNVSNPVRHRENEERNQFDRLETGAGWRSGGRSRKVLTYRRIDGSDPHPL